MVLERTLESPLDCKEIQPVHPNGDQSWFSLVGLMLKLKLQYFGYLMRRADSFEKALMLRKIEGKRRKGQLLGAALGITDKMEVWPQPPLFVPQAQTRDERVRPCDSDLFFPLHG